MSQPQVKPLLKKYIEMKKGGRKKGLIIKAKKLQITTKR